MLNPSHLRTLVVVIEQGSFVAAANRLGYTPSAVSQQMAALEASAGVALFERTARSVRPTVAAQLMAQRSTTVLAELEAIQEAVNAAKSASGESLEELRLSVYPSLVHALSPFLAQLTGADGHSSRLRLSVRDPSLSVKALVDGEDIDVSVVYRVENTGLSWPKTLQSVAVGEDPYLFVVPRSWGLHHSPQVAVEALAGRPWVLHHTGSSDSVIIESLFAAHGLRPQIVARADDFAVSLRLAGSGIAGAYVPRAALNAVPADAVVLNVPDVHLSRSVWALVAPTAPHLLTQSLLQVLREIHRADAPAAPTPPTESKGAQ
ncbi:MULTISPECIES: LysR family transcriptional regulator [unclassified Leucobacter]|uniref:LysR family transcriptional regulator n=1 Tax=unclassified Leucobacter TaxID=2621730 RepID=UPI00165E709F|nr:MULTISPECIES: LysR family transcriptional regulator [unclassified Leucobacter]MBC9926456.1 LysR family transcriptional regulator [Leucobacter sp. cx-169]